MNPWWNTAIPFRLPIKVNTGDSPRIDRIVNVTVDLNHALTDLGEAGIADLQTLHVVEVDEQGAIINEAVPFQFDVEEGDFIVRSTGERTPASTSWDGAIPEPEWLYFGASHLDRVIYLVHHEHDDAIDSYWPMEHNMTVFGFGRMNLNKYMQLTPTHFTIGFAESRDFAAISRVIDSAYKPVSVDVGQCQSLMV